MVNGGFHALVTDVEMLYPGNPHSPPRTLSVIWVNGSPAWAFGPKREKIDAMTVVRIYRKERRK